MMTLTESHAVDPPARREYEPPPTPNTPPILNIPIMEYRRRFPPHIVRNRHAFHLGPEGPAPTLCIMCQETFQIGTKTVSFLPCSHQFHHKCLYSLINRGYDECPSCKEKFQFP